MNKEKILLKFRGEWRSYQKRILDNLSYHLSDEKLHVVAAPGAGKTTLGIEVIARINRPALILCPTNTIKNQWKERICSSFLDLNEVDYVSTDLRNPAFITVSTYQALLSAFCEGSTSKDFDELDIIDESNDYSETCEDNNSNSISVSNRFSPNKADEIIKILKQANISVLCFDEAHHLRNEWWKALNYLIDELQPKQTVSLTATPPYDVDLQEWHRYEELCGPIDEIISIPELVKNNDLCPHQDFIYFSPLKENENEIIAKHNKAVAKLIKKLILDDELINYLAKMSFLTPTDDDIEKIFETPEFYVAIAVLLNSKGKTIPKEFLKLFGAKIGSLPKFNLEQANYFFNGFLITHCAEFKGLEEKIEEYTNFARTYGLMYNKKIVLNGNVKIQKQIAYSVGKIDAVKEIVGIETKNLGKDLRMVILADYIKAESADNSHPGVVPIWRKIKDDFNDIVNIGILCGSLIILPINLKNILLEVMSKNNISDANFSISRFSEDENYIKITPNESAKHKIVSIITELFNRGDITILIGTQALLGEGWDAPSINSLILSSTVSSYMLSNQMRGRAIRKDANNPNKISNIWHIASVSIPSNVDYIKDAIFKDSFAFSDINREGMYDVERLSKRFDGFEAPSYYDNHEIMSGIDRILSSDFMTKVTLTGEKAIEDINKLTILYANNREQTKKWWDSALYSTYNIKSSSIQTGIQSEKLVTKSLVFSGYKQKVISVLLTFGAILYFLFTYGLFNFQILLLWFVALCFAMIYILAKFLKTGTPASVLKQIAIVHIETLWSLGYIKTSLKKIGIKITNKDKLFLTFSNLSTEENNLLLKALQEFLDPIDNPRYVLVRKTKFLGTIKQVDYFAIPSIISANKNSVNIFQKLWNKHVGDSLIIYTRNLQGRKLLLKARKNAFSAIKRDKSRKLTIWQ